MINRDVDLILKMCGHGDMLKITQNSNDNFKYCIQNKGINIINYHTPVISEFSSSLLEFLKGIPNDTYQTVIVDSLEMFQEEDIKEILNYIYLVTSQYVVCHISSEHIQFKRDVWDNMFFQKGFRRHALTLKYFPYETLEVESGNSHMLFFEKVPDNSLKKFPLRLLQEERTLHMDMLRESGRRSDAHVQRYKVASEYVRPNDVVLDAACGLGYGSSLLWDGTLASQVIGMDISDFAIEYAKSNYQSAEKNIQFIQGDVQKLDYFENETVNLIVSMETIEHLEQPKEFLQRAYNILKPGGRIILSIPNEWVDENGIDPNPYHHHVFNKKKIETLVSEFFYIEKTFGETAGGGMKLHGSPRSWFEANGTSTEEAEWWVVLAMKSPTVDSEKEYAETVHWTHNFVHDGPYRYENAYRYPEVQHAIASIGIRASSSSLLRKLSTEISTKVEKASADYGASICVEGYAVLNEGETEKIDAQICKIEEYISLTPSKPMELRWAISNAYLLAQLYLTKGRKKEACQAYEKCVSYDFLQFSPTLATKTVSSFLELGTLFFIDNERVKAREYWKKAILTAEKAFEVPISQWIANLDEPLTFALREAGYVAEIASQAAYALWLTVDGRGIRTNIIPEINNFSDRNVLQWTQFNLSSREKEMQELLKWTIEVDKSKNWLELKYKEQEEEIKIKMERINELSNWVRDLEDGKHWLESKLGVLESVVQEKEKRISDLNNWIIELENGKSWLENKVNDLESTVNEKEKRITELLEWNKELEEGKKWLEGKLSNNS